MIRINFSKSKIFLICCGTFIIGIFLASFLPKQYLNSEIWWFGGWILLLVLTILFWQFSSGQKFARFYLILFFLSFILLGIWRYDISLSEDTPDKIWHYNLPADQAGGKTLTIIGQVANDPDVRQTNQKLEVEVMEIKEMPRQKISGKVLITTDLYPTYNYGDQLEITCKLEAPKPFEDFAYDRYLARYNIYSVCYWPEIKDLNHPLSISPLSRGRAEGAIRGGIEVFYEKIFKFKNKITEIIEIGLPEPESSLGRPIILGGQRGLDDQTRQNFSRLGLTHILAVSGFNISILAAITLNFLLLIGVGRRQAFYLSIAILLAYVILVGMPASAMRAGLMGFLVLWALHLGRLNKMTNSLVLTAAILLLINPKLLRDDIGFQLSFLALAGLVYVYPIFNDWLEKNKLMERLIFKQAWLKTTREIFTLTLAAQVFTWPIMAYNFSGVSLIAPLANLFIIWAIPILTILIIVALPLAWLAPSISFIFFLPAYVILKYIFFVADWLIRVPYGYVGVSYLWWGWLVVYYAIVGGVVVWYNKQQKLL